jgi:hypothetical protein
MDITILAAWGEFLGGIAVVVSLVYLAGQVRQNSNLLRASVTSTTAEMHMGQNEMVVQDAEVARIQAEGLSNSDSLSEIDQTRFSSMMAIQVQGMHQSFEFHLKGIGSDASWCWTDTGMRWFAAQPGFRSFWHQQLRFPNAYMPAFCEYVEGLIREVEVAGGEPLSPSF